MVRDALLGLLPAPRQSPSAHEDLTDTLQNEELAGQPQPQRELAQTRVRLQRRDQELAGANSALERSHCNQISNMSRTPTPYYRRIETSFVGRPSAFIILPPPQGDPWPDGRSTFSGKAKLPRSPRATERAIARLNTCLFAQPNMLPTERALSRRASTHPLYPCTHPRRIRCLSLYVLARCLPG
ncbi:hypothetical protein CRG98_001189 [Punica granatum]|uniref:Uncharacterized protein n=1 Tax=Punica granatum TaxID=22663 RepID=A0A2I0LDX1_PUNGR|nr:hypothetical protein CRG98_001189 [Punica granatum]